MDKDQGSWFGSIVAIATLVGSPFVGWTLDKYGRKISIILTNLTFIIGWLIIGSATSVSALYVGRLFGGVAFGMVIACVPMYIAEISTKELRGTLGAGFQLFITIGILIVYVLGMYCDWRRLALLGIVFPVCGVVAMLRMPEAPRWLISTNCRKDAVKGLAWLRDTDIHSVEDEVRDIEEGIDPSEKMSLSDFSRRELFQPLRISAGLMIFQQLSGINVVMFYTVAIFQSAGFKEGGEKATIVIGVVQVVATVVSCYLMDRAGRRPLLLLAGSGMTLACFTLGLYYHATKNGSNVEDLSWLAMASLVIYIIAFSLGWGPIPPIVMSEIFPAKAKSSASAITIILGSLSSFFITKEFVFFQEVLGQAGAFWLFAGFCLMGLAFVWRYVPETKGKSLEDIELYFLGRAIRGI